MSDERARRELAELVDDHLSRARYDAQKLTFVVNGVALVDGVMADAIDRRGNWADLRARLTEARAVIDGALEMPQPIDAALERLARARRDFAVLLIGEIERLQAGESTLV